MSWVAAVGAVVAAGTAAYSADQQKSAQKKALAAQESASGRQQSLMAPYAGAGAQALSQLQALNAGNYSGFESSPDYLYAREQMEDAVDSNAAARGLLFSGAHSKDLARSIGGLASQNLGNYRSSLMSLVNNGQQAAGAQAGYTGQAGQAAAQSGLATGDTNAQLAGAIGGIASNLAGNYGTRFSAPTTTTSSTYAPSSLWGMQQQAGQGSLAGFGNNMSSFYGWRG